MDPATAPAFGTDAPPLANVSPEAASPAPENVPSRTAPDVSSDGAEPDASRPPREDASDAARPSDPDALPAAQPEDIVLVFPEGVEVDPEINRDFRRLCVDVGLSRRQAQALADWQMRLDREFAQRQTEAADAELRQRWGAATDANRRAVRDVVQRLDRKLGDDRLSAFLGGPAGNVPVLVEALHLVSTMIGEDSLGTTSPDAPVLKETPLDAYAGMFRE